MKEGMYERQGNIKDPENDLYKLPESWMDLLSPRTQRVIEDIFRGLVNYGISNEKSRNEKEVNEILRKIANGIEQYGREDFDEGYVISALRATPILDMLTRAMHGDDEERRKMVEYISKITKETGKIRIIASQSEVDEPAYLRRGDPKIELPEGVYYSKIFDEVRRKIFNYYENDKSIMALEIEIRPRKESCEEAITSEEVMPPIEIRKRIYRRE
ncbi:MAG: hypothetical protein QXJ96_03050 [Candidatus Aenigmatarchaeota archaeon]|nr:hypothetical protein [Candidatus Aenigmarchaeota archaeon]